MQCVNCGFENTPGLASCARCRSRLDLGAVSVAPPRRGKGLRDRLTSRGRSARYAVGQVVREAREGLAGIGRRIGTHVTLAGRPVPWRLLLWSILPGMGQIKAGQKRLGRWLLLAWVAACLLALIQTGLPSSWLLYSLLLGIHCTAIALVLAPTMAGRHVMFRLAVGLVIFLGLHLLVYGPIRAAGRGFVQVFQVNRVQPNSWLADSDVLACQGRWRAGDCRPGDLVLYSIPRINVGNTFVREGAGVDRIVGMPGDRLAVRQGRLLVNGAEPARGMAPLGALDQWRDVAEIQAGPDEFLIVPSLLGELRAVPLELASQIFRVKKDRIMGKVFWRIRPISRFGPLE